tara:strand:+ start:380 stop:748 length:369 start_codon:yes stop_codon:yes gene_type:complete
MAGMHDIAVLFIFPQSSLTTPQKQATKNRYRGWCHTRNSTGLTERCRQSLRKPFDDFCRQTWDLRVNEPLGNFAFCLLLLSFHSSHLTLEITLILDFSLHSRQIYYIRIFFAFKFYLAAINQ